jgi:dihydroxy-acid dehydratase
MHNSQILYGNLAPEGSVAKITGKEGLRFEGTAKVYDSEELMMEGLNKKEITKGSLDLSPYILRNLHLQCYE